MVNFKNFKLPSTFTKSVGIPGLLVLILLSLFCGIFPLSANRVLSYCQNFVYTNLSWAYVLLFTLLLLFILLLAFSEKGRIRLGDDNSEPQFSFFSWISMLFAAGMGIGLMFYGIGEPMSHYAFPALSDTADKAKEAQLYTFFHWGFHAWAVYAVMGLILAYFSFRYKLPLAIRSGLYPLLKEKINGPIGAMVDIFALCCTFFGIATSLGLGVMQLCSGLVSIGVISESTFPLQVVILVIVTSLAIMSALFGLNKGVKMLSEVNMGIAIILLLFLLFAGPTIFLLNAFSEGLGYYLNRFVDLTFNTFAFEEEGVTWFTDWTVMFWAWWISWAPFVGLFIARISKGRTIREFCLGVIIVPSLLVFFWMTIFGNGGIWVDQNVADGALSALAKTPEKLLFAFFDYLPMSRLLSIISIFMISIFFVTSADSGILVMNSISSNNKENSPSWQKVFWGVLLISVTVALMRTGGLEALQTMFLVTALPFGLVILLLCYCLWKALNIDVKFKRTKLPYGSQNWDGSHWKERLSQIISFPKKKDICLFMTDVVEPAFMELKDRLEQLGVNAVVSKDKDRLLSIEILIPYDKILNFKYGVMAELQDLSEYIITEENIPETLNSDVYIPITYYNNGRRGNNVQYFTKEELISDVLREYERFITVVADSKNELLVIDKSNIV